MKRAAFSLPLATGVLAGVLLIATGASAQVSEKAAAEALFQDGRDLVAAGQLSEACTKFDASQRLDPALGTMLHLADCYERTGRTASAWALFEEAGSLAQASGQSDREEIARIRAAALLPRLSRVEVHVATEARLPGLVVEIGSMPVPAASWGNAIPVDAGDHVVIASAPGHASWTSTLQVTSDPAQHLTLDVPVLQLVPQEQAPRAATAAATPSTPGGEVQRLVALVTGGVGLATMSAGAILGGVAIAINDASLAACRPDDATLCTPHGVELRDEAKEFALGSTISFVTGGALLASGMIVYFTAPTAETEQVVRSVRVLAGPSGAALAVGGSW